MRAVDDAVLGDHRALLVDPQVVFHEARRSGEPHPVAAGQREVGAVGWQELAHEASRTRVDLGAGLVEARQPEVPITGERPRVVEVTAGPLLDHVVLLHVEEHDTRLQRRVRDPTAGRKQSRRAGGRTGDDDAGKRDQLPPHASPKRGTLRTHRSRRIEARVVIEDRPLEDLQVPARLEAEVAP